MLFTAKGVGRDLFLNGPVPFGIRENDVLATPPVNEVESRSLPKALLKDKPPVTLFNVKLVCIPKPKVSVSHQAIK